LAAYRSGRPFHTQVFLSTWDAVSASASNHAIREICGREGDGDWNKWWGLLETV